MKFILFSILYNPNSKVLLPSDMSRHSKIKILYDANSIAISGKSGVGYYAAYLLQALADAYPEKIEIVAHYYNFLGRRKIEGLPVANNIKYRVSKLWPGKATNVLRRLRIPLPYELLVKTRGDILLFPNFLTLPSLTGARTITTIHDLGYIRYPEFVSEQNLHDLRMYVPQSVKRSSYILTVSEFSKDEIVKTFAVNEQKVLVTPVPPPNKGTRLGKHEMTKLLNTVMAPAKYLLFIGNLEPRKNLSTLLEAYIRLPEALINEYGLVIAGGIGWKNQSLHKRIYELQRLGYKIVTPGYVTDEQKVALFNHASLVVQPALYEGFGMQILEAFQYNVPVAISDIPVFHEVAGNAAVYFDPRDATDMARRIESVLLNRGVRGSSLEQQEQELQKYSWPIIARDLYNAIQNK